MAANTNDFPANLTRAHRDLMRWYRNHGRRDLPWRNTRDPYPIYLSEIMLQQTQVKTVLERYYGPFLKHFPTLKSVALALPEQVIKQWEGLGYYSRAGNLHAAAQQCQGVLPSSAEELVALPGIGRNTAHAVACFAFGAKVPVMEANVRRVLCRVFALKQADEAVLWEKAHLFLNRKHAFEHNQAMMDIGAMVCTKRAPRCGECPLTIVCKGKSSPEAYPEPKAAKVTQVRKRTIVVFVDKKGRYYLEARKSRFLQGLYGFMEYDEGVEKVLWQGERHMLKRSQLLGAVRQVYSHFTLEAKVYLVPVKAVPGGVTLAQIAQLPLSRADHKIMKMLEEPRVLG